jgi:hypothetical protein
MPLQGGNRLHQLTQGVALGYCVFELSAQRKNFLPMQNLGFNESYWGEVREEGIMPALPRNYYGGFEFFF